LHLETDAGTRPVTGDAILDDAAARDLMVNPKDAAEHRVVVEAEREAHMPTAKDGAVEAVIDRQVRRFSHVMHLYSALEAELSH
ncbi:chorismate-binding protein, partial [Acinetobacter baumannii]